MRISELAEESGVSVATIKYYLREELLQPGAKVTPRLTEYDDSHVRRLRLIRIMREIGDVPVEKLRAVVVATRSAATVHELFAAAADALAPSATPGGPDRERSRAMADDLIERAGWTRVRSDAVDRENLAAALEAVVRAGTHAPPDPEQALPYLRAADELARFEIGHLDGAKDRTGLLEEMVVGQVVFGELLAVLRRLAEEHHSFERFGSPS